MPTDELLHDPDMDRALRDLLPAFGASTTATARQRDDLIAFIETGDVTQRAAPARHDPGRTLELVAERPVRPRKGRVLVGVAAASAVLLAGLLIAPRWQGAERPLGTVPSPTALGAAATTAPPTTAPDVLDAPTLDAIDRRACALIGSSPSNFERRIEIDCGSDDGLRVGMPVVTAAGLVGKITTVALDTAVVMLVADPQYSVQVSIAAGEAPIVGVLRGMGGDRLPQAGLTESDGATGSPTVGDAVTTAGGTDSLAPAGLPVGRVAAVDASTGAPVYDVQPVAFVDPDEPLVVLLYVSPREAGVARTA